MPYLATKIVCRCLVLLTLAGVTVATSAVTSPPKPMTKELRVALKDTIALAAKDGEALWSGYSKVPFGFLLIQEQGETLLCDPRLPDGFVRGADEPLLRCKQAFGPSTWRRPSLLAAMPVFGPPSLIVMGTPDATKRSLGEWKTTILHEHFHQWQSNQPGYYDRVAALNLSDGDQTGMWMLNYAFPYNDNRVGIAYARAADTLRRAIVARNGREFQEAFQHYRAARQDLQLTVTERDWRYFEFQLWQEGVARWTEFTLGALSPQSDVRAAASATREKTLGALSKPNIKADGRLAVYDFGAGEAMLLERVNPNWRQCYGNEFALGPRFDASAKC